MYQTSNLKTDKSYYAWANNEATSRGHLSQTERKRSLINYQENKMLERKKEDYFRIKSILTEFLERRNHEILDRYSQAPIIGTMDLLILLSAYKYCNLLTNVPDLIKAVYCYNQNGVKPEILSIFMYLKHLMNEYTGNVVMRFFADNQFLFMNNFNQGSVNLVKTCVVYSQNIPKGYDEVRDGRNFDVFKSRKDKLTLIDAYKKPTLNHTYINAYRFDSKINLSNPQEQLIQY